MESYLTIDKGKAETVLFWWVYASEYAGILKFLLDVPIISYNKVTNMYIGIAGKAMVSNTALAWLGNGDVRPRNNSSMLRDPGVRSSIGRANVARGAPRATVFIYYTGSQSTREVVFVTKQGKHALFSQDYSRS